MAGLEEWLRQEFGLAETATHTFVHEVVEEAGQRLITRTPIDTGRAKSNWNYGLMNPDPSVTQATNIRVLNHLAEMPKRPAGLVHYLTNSLPYIPALERGHSKQAPQGMVGLTALEMDSIMAAAAQRAKGGQG